MPNSGPWACPGVRAVTIFFRPVYPLENKNTPCQKCFFFIFIFHFWFQECSPTNILLSYERVNLTWLSFPTAAPLRLHSQLSQETRRPKFGIKFGPTKTSEKHKSGKKSAQNYATNKTTQIPTNTPKPAQKPAQNPPNTRPEITPQTNIPKNILGSKFEQCITHLPCYSLSRRQFVSRLFDGFVGDR